VPGCEFRGNGVEMEAHNAAGAAEHTRLWIAGAVKEAKDQLMSEFTVQLEARLKRQKSEFEMKMKYQKECLEGQLETERKEAIQHKKSLESLIEEERKKTIHLYLLDFCRQWMKRKPDPLFHFKVYRPSNPPYTRLLCGIPGPKRTPWEGGWFPVHMAWHDITKPPICKFLPPLHHVNVFPSGKVGLSSLYDVEYWQPDFSVPELLFDIQQLLAHPNQDSPAQESANRSFVKHREGYNKLA